MLTKPDAILQKSTV